MTQTTNQKTATPRAAVVALQKASIEPLQWEIELLKNIPDIKDRLDILSSRKIVHTINALETQAEMEVYIGLVARAVGISVKAVEDLLARCVDLYKEISEHYGGAAGIKRADPFELAETIYNWFSGNEKGRFFKTGDGKVWLFFHGHIFEIGNNLTFNTLMFRLTRLAAIEKPGSTVWYYLQTMCSDRGEPIDMTSWLFTDREKDTIYLNLNSSHNKILKVTAGEDPSPIDNGTNEHSVLLSSSPQIKPFNFQPAQGEVEGFRALKTLLMDATPCERPQRYFLLCWTITAFLMDYQGDRGLLQVIGTSGLGKSKVAERISYLVYGENYVGSGTGAGDVRIATHNPIIFKDNLENRDINQNTLNTLLLLANGATKPKAKTGSDTEVVYQRLKSMGVVTSIEPFPGKYPELINRTFAIELDQAYRTHGYMHDEVCREIQKKRPLMLSAIFSMIARSVLPRLAERTDWSKQLQMHYPGHNKERMNEHLCMMLLVLEGVLYHVPLHKDETPVKKQAADILNHWISDLEEQAHQTAITSNTLLTLMNSLAQEVFIKIRGKGDDIKFQEMPEFNGPVKVYLDPDYHEHFYLAEPQEEVSDDDDELTVMVQRFEIIITAAHLHTLFNRFCASQHIRNPFDTPTALGARISNDRGILEKGGWKFISRKPEFAPRYKKKEGDWYWRFSKKIRSGRFF